MMPTLQINEEYRRLVRPLTAEEYDNLKADIQKVGTIYIPIVINKEGSILDGHHRYLIAEELSIPWNQIPIKEVDFKDKLDEKEYVIKANLNRRQLSIVDKAFLANELHKIELERKSMSSQNKMGTPRKRKQIRDPTKKKPRAERRKKETTHKSATQHGISETTLRKYQAVQDSEHEDLKTRLDRKDISIDKAHKTLAIRKRTAQLLQDAVDTISNNSNNNQNDESTPLLIHGDFKDVQRSIESESIELIFTDPPYLFEAAISYYEGLASLADRVLKPGGSLVSFVPQPPMGHVFEAIKKGAPSLKYWWMLAVLHSGRHSRMYDPQIAVQWKPLLWYVKGKERNTKEWVHDLIESTPPDKTLHEWAQSSKEAEYLISKTTKPRDIVLDPFMGSGTTGMAALMLDRKFIGIEIDADKFALAKARLTRYGNPRSE